MALGTRVWEAVLACGQARDGTHEPRLDYGRMESPQRGPIFDAATLVFGTGIRRLRLPCESLSDLAVAHCGSYEGAFPLAAVGEPVVFLTEGARNPALAVLTPGLAPGSRRKALRERLRTRRPTARDPGR